jgi:hypothetical protein
VGGEHRPMTLQSNTLIRPAAVKPVTTSRPPVIDVIEWCVDSLVPSSPAYRRPVYLAETPEQVQALDGLVVTMFVLLAILIELVAVKVLEMGERQCCTQPSANLQPE